MKKKLVSLISIIACLALVTGCGEEESSVPVSGNEANSGNNYGDVSGNTNNSDGNNSSDNNGNHDEPSSELDQMIADFVSDINIDVPLTEQFELDEYDVLYYYAYEQYLIYASGVDKEGTIEEQYAALFTEDTNLVNLNDETYTVEDYGYYFGDSDQKVIINFYSEEGYFYLTIYRYDGLAGSLDVSKVDTNWYVDYINFDGYTLVDVFPGDLIVDYLGVEAQVVVPDLTSDPFPAAFIEAYEDDSYGNVPDTQPAAVSVPLHLPGELRRPALGLAEDHSLPSVGIEYPAQGVLPTVPVRLQIVLGDEVEDDLVLGHEELLRVHHLRYGQFADVVGHGRREEHRLPLPGHLGQDEVQILPESHVQHPVGLVQHHHGHLGHVERLLRQHVLSPAGGAHNYVLPRAELPDLMVDVRTAVHGYADVSGERRHLRQLLGHLERQFPGRDDDYRGGRPEPAADAAQDHGAVGAGLPGPGLRLYENVPAGETSRYSGLLHRGGPVPTHPLHGPDDVDLDPELIERFHADGCRMQSEIKGMRSYTAICIGDA